MQMDKHKEADPDAQNPRKRKQEDKEMDGENVSWFCKLPDEILIAILSRMWLWEAARTSVLSSRWRNLWKFRPGILFLHSLKPDLTMIEREKLKDMVNLVLAKHQGPLDALIIKFSPQMKGESNNYFCIREWVYFAMSKQVKRLELDLSVPIRSHSEATFPSLLGLLNQFPSYNCSPSVSDSDSLRALGAFCSLRSLRLVDVHISDVVVEYFLESCPCIEELCIRASNTTINLRVVDPLPNLKVLEISDCCNIESLEISVASLVSCTYQGREIDLPFKKHPSLHELTLGGKFSESFICQPNQHSTYSPQLLKLVLNIKNSEDRAIAPAPPRDLHQLWALKRLELNILSQLNRSLLFFMSLIKASPHLQEFKIQIDYILVCRMVAKSEVEKVMPFPEVTSVSNFHHENLKRVEMVGYYGCESEDELLVQISKMAPSLETVSIDVNSRYFYDHPVEPSVFLIYRHRLDGQVPMDPSGSEHYMPGKRNLWAWDRARKHAQKLASTFPSKIKFVIEPLGLLF